MDEPKNKYDPNAIAALLFNVKIDYIPADDTSRIRNFKQKEKPSICLYQFNGKYRAELTIAHR